VFRLTDSHFFSKYTMNATPELTLMPTLSIARHRTFISLCNQPLRSTQPGYPFVGRRNEYTSQRALTPCGSGVKTGMVCVWVAGKTVLSHCYTRAISEHFRDKGLIYMKRYINSSVCLLYRTEMCTMLESLSVALFLRVLYTLYNIPMFSCNLFVNNTNLICKIQIIK